MISGNLKDRLMPKTIHMPCGSSAVWDRESEMGYRCTTCFAMVGSIGEPRQCRDAADLYRAMKTLGVKGGWDYIKGREIDE